MTNTNKSNDKEIFKRLESEVRGYCRSFPTVFETAQGHELVDERGRRYIDFFAGAGALNYGHNNPVFKERLVEYVLRDGVTHSLDMHTSAKRDFLETLEAVVLKPRGLEYRVMFPGPTGTNAVEAALKLARKATGRTNVVSFTGGFHGMTLGSLAVTGNAGKRNGASVPLSHAVSMPFAGSLGEGDSLDVFESFLNNSSSGMDKPAAVILETVQAEGGVNVPSPAWLERLWQICRAHEVLTIADDIQVGCGRTGPFFSFERASIRPDFVTLSKSLSGYGTPLSIVLIRPDLDRFKPGEHNGTFRGHNLAFVTATAALDAYWRSDALSQEVEEKAAYAEKRFRAMVDRFTGRVKGWRGLGLIQGIEFEYPSEAAEVSATAFEHGLLIETAGSKDEVLKLLPPLTLPSDALARGLDIVEESIATVVAAKRDLFAASEVYA